LVGPQPFLPLFSHQNNCNIPLGFFAFPVYIRDCSAGPYLVIETCFILAQVLSPYIMIAMKDRALERMKKRKKGLKNDRIRSLMLKTEE
jgi:hypothetical protein